MARKPTHGMTKTTRMGICMSVTVVIGITMIMTVVTGMIMTAGTGIGTGITIAVSSGGITTACSSAPERGGGMIGDRIAA